MNVSVIIASTREDSLPNALASVEAQTRPPKEVIVVEDDVRLGPACARNYGVERASGEFYAFLDDDDRWHPEFLERVRIPDGYVMAYSALPHLRHQDPRDGCPTVPSAAVVRAETFHAVGGFRPFRYGEDYDLYLRMFRLGPFHRVPETLVNYDHRNSSERFLIFRIYSAMVLELFRREAPSSFGERGRKGLAREYRLLAHALQRQPSLQRKLRRVQRMAAAESLRLRFHSRGVKAWIASFLGRGDRDIPLPQTPPELPGRVLPLLYDAPGPVEPATSTP